MAEMTRDQLALSVAERLEDAAHIMSTVEGAEKKRAQARALRALIAERDKLQRVIADAYQNVGALLDAAGGEGRAGGGEGRGEERGVMDDPAETKRLSFLLKEYQFT